MKFNGKLLASAAAGAMVFVSGCCITGKCPQKETQKCLIQKEDVKLLLPDKIYAVPGVETNVYFEHIFLERGLLSKLMYLDNHL